jgi:hypothetical protein
MTRDEIQRLTELARRLDSTPRRVLTVIAQTIGSGSGPQAALQTLREGDLQRVARAEACAELLLTPVSSFARDSLASALDMLWRDSRRTPG